MPPTGPSKIQVIYRDSYLIAAHKPHDLATYQESRAGHAPGCKELLEEQLNQRLFPVHRIDADTSGLVLFALDSRTAAALIRAFKEQQIKKTYLAWCVGTLPGSGSIKTPLKKHNSELNESARTDYEVVKRERGYTQVKVSPFTGRFHQIRRHFEMQGHPLVGDPKYGNPDQWKSFFKNEPRLMLQAQTLELVHPQTRKPLSIKTKAVL